MDIVDPSVRAVEVDMRIAGLLIVDCTPLTTQEWPRDMRGGWCGSRWENQAHRAQGGV